MDKSKVAYVSPDLANNRSNDKVSARVAATISVDDYESMVKALYAYRFGSIGFLDLLAKFEEILGIKSPQTGLQNILDTEE
jgi:hypothetical protein